MHSKNKKDCLKTVLFYSHLQKIPHMWYLLIPRCSFLYHICGTFLSTTEKCILYHICGIFLIPQEGKKPPLDVPFPENMVSLDGGERSAAVPCFSLYVNQSSECSFSQIHTYLFWGWRLFRCVLQLHAGHDLRYVDFSGPPQRRPYFLHFKGSIFTTPKEPPQRFFLNRHISRYLNFNSQAYFEISIPQHGKKKSIKKPMSKFINYFFCLKKISLILGV